MNTATRHMHAPNNAYFDGPVELVKLIFDSAAHDSKSTALSLMRTCKTSREWAIPSLYTDVQLSSNPSAVRFQRTLESSNSPSSKIRTLCGPNLPEPEILSQTCQKLERLSLYNYDVQRYLSRLYMPALRHVTIAGQMRYVKFAGIGSGQTSYSKHGSPDVKVELPGLLNATHVRFANDVPRLPDDFVSKHAPRLSHFSCCYHPASATGAPNRKMGADRWDALGRCLGTVLKGPGVRVVLVYVHSVDAKEGAAVARMIMSTFPGEGRIVVATGAELPEETSDLSPGYDAGWTYAEVRLRMRRAGAGNVRC